MIPRWPDWATVYRFGQLFSIIWALPFSSNRARLRVTHTSFLKQSLGIYFLPKVATFVKLGDFLPENLVQ